MKKNYMTLKDWQVLTGSGPIPEAHVGFYIDDEVERETEWGVGPVNAAYKAIDKIVERIYNVTPRLTDYGVKTVKNGSDAHGIAYATVSSNGVEFKGRAVSADIMKASIVAYVRAINQMLYHHNNKK